MTVFARAKTRRVSREQMDLVVHEVKSAHNYNLLHCNPFILNIWHVLVMLHVPLCDKLSV